VASEAGKGSAGRRVLLVDDNVALQESLGFILESTGCEIRAVSDGAAALELAVNWLPQVVFLDVHMPGLNGFEVARRLRASYTPAQMRLVLMSGVSLDEPLRREAEKAGFDACIDKMAEPELWVREVR
jgi:CheY-like chemotaxis protein